MTGNLIPITAAPSAPGRSLGEPLLTKKELAALLKVSTRTIERWQAEGMPFEPWTPRMNRYYLSGVRRWLSRSRSATR